MLEKPLGRGLTVPKNPAAMLRALNTKHAEESETNNTTILQTSTLPVEISPSPLSPQDSSVEAVVIAPENQTIKQSNNQTNRQKNKPTKKQTNNTTESSSRRDGRTLRSRQPISDPTATIVTSFRISVLTMEMLDRFCFENRIRKQDVVEQALTAYMAEDEE